MLTLYHSQQIVLSVWSSFLYLIIWVSLMRHNWSLSIHPQFWQFKSTECLCKGRNQSDCCCLRMLGSQCFQCGPWSQLILLDLNWEFPRWLFCWFVTMLENCQAAAIEDKKSDLIFAVSKRLWMTLLACVSCLVIKLCFI